MEIANLAQGIFGNLNAVWSFLLLVLRYGGLLIILPGLSAGFMGMYIRMPAVLVLAFATVNSGPYAPLPADYAQMLGQAASEFLLGYGIGMIPQTLISGAQMAGLLSSTAMGLGASALIDPVAGVSVTDVARLFGDLCILLFLSLGGHYVAIQAVSGMQGSLPVGVINPATLSLDVLINATAHIFAIGVMISAPVMVALLLTQFVMGLVTKAVPTVNVFVVSFPLTIGIGLILTALSLREMLNFSYRELQTIDGRVVELVEGATKTSQP